MAGSTARVTLLSDFGTADGYAAAMKGMIAAISTAVLIDDATHDIPPGDVAAGAWALAGYWSCYPAGTVHLAVVDPGVGSGRRALAAEIDGHVFVAPDNGLLSRVLDEARSARVLEITPASVARDVVSNTFHGRDLFAPAAAHLAAGVPAGRIGTEINDPVRLPPPRAERTEGGGIIGEVVHVDRFGNLVTSIPAGWMAGRDRVRIGVHTMPVTRVYAQAAPGESIALIGSRGLVEISVRDGSAAALLHAMRGDTVSA